MIRTGILGGSFNPIHYGHVALARQLKERAGLDEVWLMVSPQNPLKQTDDLLADEARLEMVRAAVDGEPGLSASDYEMHLPRPSYTWNTLQALSHDYPERAFVLLIGGDNRQLFDRWYHADDILRNYQVVVYPRDSHADPTDGHEQTLPSDGFTIVEAELMDVSSTAIRERIRQGKSIRGLVPRKVETLIKKNGYYA